MLQLNRDFGLCQSLKNKTGLGIVGIEKKQFVNGLYDNDMRNPASLQLHPASFGC